MKEINEQLFNSDLNLKNRSINDYLEKGEKVLWHEKPKAKSYVMSRVISLTPFAIVWLIIDSMIIFGLIGSGSIFEMPIFAIVFFVVFFALHLMPVWIWILNMVKAKNEIKNTEYYITNKRVISTNFPNQMNINQLNIVDVKEVSLSKKALDKIFRVGDVTITTNKKTFVLYDIEQPEKIYAIFEKIKSKFENLSNLPSLKICDYCGSNILESDNKCSNCGAPYDNKL